jgi:hypothetical protein
MPRPRYGRNTAKWIGRCIYVEQAGATRASSEKTLSEKHSLICESCTTRPNLQPPLLLNYLPHPGELAANHARCSSRMAAPTEVGRIDVTFFAQGRRQIAELKSFATATTPHAALRYALGQLLSYNYGAGRSVADRWWIVVDEELSQADRDFSP